MIAGVRLCAEFERGFVHGDDVFGRNVGLEVVDSAQHVTAVVVEVVEAAAHLFADVFGGPQRKYSLRVYGAPEGEIAAELAL